MENKQKIISKFIELLQFEGWSNNTLEKAAKECGFDSGYLSIIYPGGISEFTNEFITECNDAALKVALDDNFAKLRTTQKVEEIIYRRIGTYHNVLGSIDNVRKFVGYCGNPVNVPGSLRNIYSFSSDVWYLLGDKSTDFNYYTKRISLSAIYTKCMLYSLSDKSDNLTQTKKYIQKSIDGLMKINKLKQKVNDILNYSKLRTKRK
jgi:ubiquinone biosynthesis protein COQ9